MSISKHQVQETREVSEYICDFCGKGKVGATSVNRHACHICRRHFHDTCAKRIYRGDGDYPDHICGECWEIGQPYRVAIEEYEQAEDDQLAAWYKAAVEAAEDGATP